MTSPWLAVEAGADLLARAREIEKSWERLLVGGGLDPERPPEPATGLRPMIVESWQRTLATGLEPTDLLPSIEADPSETRERWLEHPLGLLRHVLVAPLEMLAEESKSVVQVTDASGLTLHLGGPAWLKAAAAEMNLVEGARCSETVNGTNGVGTALATDHPVQVFAFEHFSYHHREWVCSGAPIHDLVSGRLVGIIDLSSPWRIAHPRSLELVTKAARATEQSLLEARRDHDARLRRRYGDLMMRSTDLLVNREGYVLIGGDSAHPKPLNVPQSGGEVTMDDGSAAVAEALGHGEAYLVRRVGPVRRASARSEAFERAERRARELATEQAALRQVATLVAHESSPGRLVAVVAEQVARVFAVPLVRLIRYEADAAVVVGGFSERGEEPFTIGSRWPLETPGLIATIRQTGRPARVEDYAQTPGENAAVARTAGLRSAVGSPIVVGGRVWGAIVLLSPRPGSLPDDTGARLADFTELLATALANAESRAALSRLAEEQAALRRVATLVAREASPVELLVTVAEEVARVLDVEAVGLLRFEPDGTATLVAQSDTPWDPPPLGTRFTLEGENVVTALFRSGEAARLDDWGKATGPVAEMARVLGIRSSVATPIVVEGRLWGTLIAVTSQSAPIPRETDSRIGEFTELVATAIANAGAREELSRLVEEQTALRRVATLVAKGATPDEVFDAVRVEVEQMFGMPNTIIMRFDADESATLLATPSEYLGPIGTRWSLKGDDSAVGRVYRTGRPARADYTAGGGGPLAEAARRGGTHFPVAVPVVVDGALWGVMSVGSPGPEPPPNLESRLAKFTELLATAIANTEARTQVQRLADEQAALRRVATLVAMGVSSGELFTAVAQEAADVLAVPIVALQRYEADGTFTMVSIAGETTFTVGSRWPVEDEGLAGMILATGRTARKQDYTTMPGPLGAALREGGLISAVGVPIVVEGSIWGFMTAGARPGKPIPDGTEERLARFTELVAAAIADSQAREQLAQLASEQAALRRVATMVAHESPSAERFAEVAPAPASEQLFSTVAREVAAVLDVPGVIVTRYEADGTAVTVGEAFGPDLAGAERVVGVGAQMPPEPGSLVAEVFNTHASARVDDLSTSPGTVGAVAHAAGLGSACAGPIVVNGALWGKMCVFSRVGAVLPAGTEDRLRDFIDLLATAIANYQTRAELAASEARASELADEQAALRRVATLVARGVEPEEMFSAVTDEIAQLFGTSRSLVGRFERDGSAHVVVGASSGIRRDRPVLIGSRWQLQDYMASTRVYRTGHPVRVERSDFEHASGPMADMQREVGVVSIVAAPIVVEGKRWGFVTVSDVNETLPVDTERRLEKFAELVATAIANAESRGELAASEARARKLADEHAALRRVATLVAEGAKGEAVFSAVAHEVAHVFSVQHVTVCRYEPDTILVLSSFEAPEKASALPPFPAGRRLPLDVPSLPASVYRTGKPVRIDEFTASGGLFAIARQAGLTAAVGVPIVVDGTVWGAVNVASTNNEGLRTDAEERLARFTELVATAVSNASMREELAASRARVIAASDETRRRIERDLHDGAQQRLVTLAVTLARAQARIPAGLDELTGEVSRVREGLTMAVEELRELSQGIHPSILTEGGLSPALKALGRRSAVRVKLDVGFEHRLPDHIEVAAYYTASEALTNAEKHAQATRVSVSVRLEDEVLGVSIRDDGVGGADARRGSGLTGLKDRIEALGGTIQIASPPGRGTHIEVHIPGAVPRSAARDARSTDSTLNTQ